MVYDLQTDHAEIKKQIKEWELKIDSIRGALLVYEAHEEEYCSLSDLGEELEEISHEMMTINL